MKGILCSCFLLALIGCGTDYETKYYQAVSLNKSDTALLKLEFSKEAFDGKYLIKYDDRSKDSGAVTGRIKGDTLVGKYTFLSRGNVQTVRPIAFLRNGEGLKLGEGVAGTFMGFQVYMSGSIAFNDSLFQFKPIKVDEYSALTRMSN